MSIYTMRTKLGHQIKWALGLVALTVIVGAFYSFGPGGGPGQSRAEDENAVIADVNGVEITRGEYDTMWDAVSHDQSQTEILSPFDYAGMRARLFTQMVQQKLWLAAAEKEGIPVDDSAVNAEIDKYVTERLVQDRKSVLGANVKGPKDPRQDQAYIKELEASQTSLGEREDAIKRTVSPELVRAQLAVQGLMAKLKADVSNVSDSDIKASYNVSKVSMVSLMAFPGSPKEQLKAKAAKIQKEAAAGGDLKTVAKAVKEAQFSQFDYKFETSAQMPSEIRTAIEKLQPGKVSPVVDSDMGIYVFKVDSVTSAFPAKLDEKAKTARKNMIIDTRTNAKMTEFQKTVIDPMPVTPKDPEMLGYWKLTEAQKLMMTDPAKSNAKKAAAIKAFKLALDKNPNNPFARAQLAALYIQDNNNKEAALLLGSMFAGASAMENADLRLQYGNVLVKLNRKDEALKSYDIAMRMSKNNPNVLQQLVGVYKDLGKPELSAQAAAMLADYQKREAEFKKMQEKNNPAPAPQPAPAPAPKPGN